MRSLAVFSIATLAALAPALAHDINAEPDPKVPRLSTSRGRRRPPMAASPRSSSR